MPAPPEPPNHLRATVAAATPVAVAMMRPAAVAPAAARPAVAVAASAARPDPATSARARIASRKPTAAATRTRSTTAASRWRSRRSAPPTARRPTPTPASRSPTSGPAPIGVPNFVIDQFTIPPFLLPIYQACGTQYGIPWQVLASINRIETAFGTNLNVSTAGALGLDAVHARDLGGVRGRRQQRRPQGSRTTRSTRSAPPARYLQAPPVAEENLDTAIFAYNHADWYVDEVLLYASQYGQSPDDLVGSLTGLTEGARFPVAANSRYADDISERRALERSKPGKRAFGNAAEVISSSPTRRGIDIFSREGAPVVAVNDGVITDIGKSKELGRYMVLRDAYGNRFTYAKLGEVSDVYPVQKQKRLSAADFELVSPRRPDGRSPRQRASAGDNEPRRGAAEGRRRGTPSQAAEKAAAKRTGPGQHRGHPRAPLRLPGARQQRRPRRPHRTARQADEGQVPRLRILQVLLLQRPALRPQDDGVAAAEGGLERDRAAPCSARSARPRPASLPTSTS